jgi:hypothetical protein
VQHACVRVLAFSIDISGNGTNHEREGYTVSLAQGNYENDLQAAQSESFHSNDCGLFLTGSVSTDINALGHASAGSVLSKSCSDVQDLPPTTSSKVCNMRVSGFWRALACPRAGPDNSSNFLYDSWPSCIEGSLVRPSLLYRRVPHLNSIHIVRLPSPVVTQSPLRKSTQGHRDGTIV